MFSCGNKKSSETIEVKHQLTIIKLEVLYTDLSTETPYRIDCDKFEWFFKNELKRKFIKSKNILEKISNGLMKIESNKPVKDKLDTRFRIKIYYYNNKEENLCGNETFIEKNGFIYKISDEFLTELGIKNE
jgi:hypothetical protein